MSNSSLVSYTRLSPHCSKRTHVIDTITIHCYVGQVSAKQGCDYFATTDRDASSNYVIGYDGEIGLSVDESCRAYTSSNYANDNRAVTIEVACAPFHPYEVTVQALNSVIALCADICKRNGIDSLKWQADKSLIGQIDKQNMTVHRWFANKACVPISSEVLTKSGWVKIKDVEIGDEIACADLDNLRITFEEVYDKIEQRKQDTYTSNGITATKDHRMVYCIQENKTYRIENLCNLLKGNNQYYIPLAGYRKADGLKISNEMLAFLIAIQADGHYMYEKNKYGEKKYYGLEFHFSKERKINRLKELLDVLKFPYKENVQSNGTTKIRIYNYDGINIVNDICEKYLHDKMFTWKWLDLSEEQAKYMIAELQLWDGCEAAKLYTSSKAQNLDVVSAICALNGIGSRVSGCNIQFRDKPYNTLSHETKRNNRGDLTQVACVSVKTGIFLMRQNGKTIIVGNCPGDYLYNKHGYIAEEVNKILRPVEPEKPKGDFADMTESEKKDFVKNLYIVYLGREADKNGIDYWCKLINDDTKLVEIEKKFSRTVECRKYAVQNAYRNVLGREADEGGLNYWIDFLTNHTFADLYAKFSELKKKGQK